MSMLHRSFPRLLALIAGALFLCGVASATAESSSPPPSPLLPPDFAGWHLSAPINSSTAPEAADNANADLLKEDGFTQFASATYERNGDKLSVRAMHFGDASGAYAAYTYYWRPGLPKQEVGYGGVFDGT